MAMISIDSLSIFERSVVFFFFFGFFWELTYSGEFSVTSSSSYRPKLAMI
jgi:hypothetical protein